MTTPATFTAAEVEFLAEDETVSIIPFVRMEALNMISGDYGPFRPAVAAQVPIWLAISLKKRGKCRIKVPDWMDVEKLRQVLENERELPSEFQPLPFHYVEVSRLLFDHARDDVPDLYLMKSLIEDIRNVRFHKVEAGLESLSRKTYAVKLKNLSAMEVNLIRPFTVRALQAFYKHGDEELLRDASVRSAQSSQRSLGGSSR